MSSVGTVKSPSPVPISVTGVPRLNSKVEVSFASKLLTEEIQKQQGQENSRIKGLIVKEVRKQGKRELLAAQDQLIFEHIWLTDVPFS